MRSLENACYGYRKLVAEVEGRGTVEVNSISHVSLEPGRFSRSLGARVQRKDCPRHTSLYWIGRAALLGESAETWAEAVARNRPEHCIRVLQGLLALHAPRKHRGADIDRACQVPLASG